MNAHTHSHHGHHDHHPADAGSRLIWALLLTLGFAAIEALAGFWSGSLALLGDAGHMVTDSASLGLAAFAVWLTKRPPSRRHTYGLGRVETLAALINVLFMVVVVVGLSVAAIHRVLEPTSVNGKAVTLVAVVGLLINVGVAWLLMHGEQTMNTRGALAACTRRFARLGRGTGGRGCDHVYRLDADRSPVVSADWPVGPGVQLASTARSSECLARRGAGTSFGRADWTGLGVRAGSQFGSRLARVDAVIEPRGLIGASAGRQLYTMAGSAGVCAARSA